MEEAAARPSRAVAGRPSREVYGKLRRGPWFFALYLEIQLAVTPSTKVYMFYLF